MPRRFSDDSKLISGGSIVGRMFSSGCQPGVGATVKQRSRVARAVLECSDSQRLSLEFYHQDLGLIFLPANTEARSIRVSSTHFVVSRNIPPST